MTTLYQAMKRLSIIDESLITTSPENCCLYVQAALPFVSFCLFDRIHNKYISLCEYRIPDGDPYDELIIVLQQDEILSAKPYYKVVVSLAGYKSVLIPSSIYQEADAARFLSITTPSSSNETLCTDHLKYTDAVHIYSVPTAIASLFSGFFQGTSIVHAATVLMESELLRNKNNTDPCVAVNVRQGSFEIVVTKGNQLTYYNTFSFQSSEDFIYYLLYVLEQLRLNPEKTQVRFTGEIEKQSASWIITAKYIRNISFGNHPEAFEYSYGFKQVSQHAHNTLLNQYLCG
ncbi:MAG: DUF3822 family protein [Bacteroidota bacterium]